MNSQLSIYIPRMSTAHCEHSIRQIMSTYSIGTVDYIDFTQINKKPGFGENVDQVVMSAFVHFSQPVSYDKLNYKFWGTITQDQPYKLQVTPTEYWICLRNKNPVQRTYMNIHQVVENGRYLENLIEEQSKVIKSLREIVDKQEKKISGIDQVIYQLLGGLFNSSTQSETIDTYVSVMDIETYEHDKRSNNSKWESWPTTRQGDSNEERIEKLEEVIKRLDFDCECFDNESQDSNLCERRCESYRM